MFINDENAPIKEKETSLVGTEIREEKKLLKRGYPFVAVAFAIAVVWGLSYVPWGNMTGNFIKDYDLFADLRPNDSTKMVIAANEVIDPELTQAIGNLAADSMAMAAQSDSVAAIALPEDSIEIAPIPYFNPRVDGDMIIEDYTQGSKGLDNLKAALAADRPARIAVIGDSYIEGDIFTQDIRAQLQEKFGGQGVGYVPPHSGVAGFRRTVSIKGEGWKEHSIQKGKGGDFPNIAGEYFTADGKATVTYKGNAKDSRLSSWSSSSILFVASDSGKIVLTNDNETKEYEVSPSEGVQKLELSGSTSSFKVECSVPKIAFLGSWLHDKSGVVVDCMSMRGVSGVGHKKIKTDLASQMRKYVDYDLIILEYGINALTATQSDYTAYGKLMCQVVNHMRQCYPNSDILLMGIGDRGQKVNGEVHSLPTATYMVNTQRKVARDAGCLFWDTREAMGGEDAIVDWRQRSLANGDYIHLNSAGGKVLATELVASIMRLIQ